MEHCPPARPIVSFCLHNLYFLSLRKITSFEKPDPPSPSAWEELIFFFFPLCFPNSVLYYNQVFTKRRCHILRKALNQELDDLDSGAATGWFCIFNKALVLTCKMQITLASPALQTGRNEMCGSAWKFSSLVPGLGLG